MSCNNEIRIYNRYFVFFSKIPKKLKYCAYEVMYNDSDIYIYSQNLYIYI